MVRVWAQHCPGSSSDHRSDSPEPLPSGCAPELMSWQMWWISDSVCLFVFVASHKINIKVAVYQEPGSGEVLHLQP